MAIEEKGFCDWSNKNFTTNDNYIHGQSLVRTYDTNVCIPLNLSLTLKLKHIATGKYFLVEILGKDIRDWRVGCQDENNYYEDRLEFRAYGISNNIFVYLEIFHDETCIYSAKNYPNGEERCQLISITNFTNSEVKDKFFIQLYNGYPVNYPRRPHGYFEPEEKFIIYDDKIEDLVKRPIEDIFNICNFDSLRKTKCINFSEIIPNNLYLFVSDEHVYPLYILRLMELKTDKSKFIISANLYDPYVINYMGICNIGKEKYDNDSYYITENVYLLTERIRCMIEIIKFDEKIYYLNITHSKNCTEKGVNETVECQIKIFI